LSRASGRRPRAVAFEEEQLDTAERGERGFHVGVDAGLRDGRRQRARFFGRNTDVPTMIIAIGAGAQIARVLLELGGLLRRPVLTLERVRVCKRDGELLAEPPRLPAVDERGRPLWQKLMIYTSEQQRFEGHPACSALIRRLRLAGARGATALRGIWGFHGDRAPHGDKLLQVRRHVPVVTIVIDTPEAIARSFPIVDEITRERGLVTTETVPRTRHPRRRRAARRDAAGPPMIRSKRVMGRVLRRRPAAGRRRRRVVVTGVSGADSGRSVAVRALRLRDAAGAE
jgi:PII-like signaling protein